MRSLQPGIAIDLAPAHLGPQPYPIFGDDDAVQSLQSLQIDQQLWRSEPKRKHRHKALASGDDPSHCPSATPAKRPLLLYSLAMHNRTPAVSLTPLTDERYCYTGLSLLLGSAN